MITAVDYQARQSEASFQATVKEAAETFGWLCIHFPAMLANPSGWPDLLCFRDGQCRVMELKAERGKLGLKQIEMIGRLAAVGVDVLVLRPSDWELIMAILE
jgi:hypothetical protein